MFWVPFPTVNEQLLTVSEKSPSRLRFGLQIA